MSCLRSLWPTGCKTLGIAGTVWAPVRTPSTPLSSPASARVEEAEVWQGGPTTVSWHELSLVILILEVGLQYCDTNTVLGLLTIPDTLQRNVNDISSKESTLM